jgi:RNA polymerase sigma factor (sigma-70 family)
MSRQSQVAKTKLEDALQDGPDDAARPDVVSLPDGELLTRYVANRDEKAFEVLVRRHGAMVFGVCRRILGNEADAEDAFQATFLVLIRKASSVRQRGTVGNWLYGVAFNTARKAKAMLRKRREKERQATASRPTVAEDAGLAVLTLVDGELSHLPERYRIPIVLCDLEGKTIQEAMRHLGWPQGTVASRLARGRALLATRLARQGVALTVGVLANTLAQTASAAVSPQVMTTTTQTAALFAAGKTEAACGASANAAFLTEGVLKAMLLAKLNLTAAALALTTLLSLAVGAVALQGPRTNAKGEAQVGDNGGARAARTDFETFLPPPTPAIPQKDAGNQQHGEPGPVRALVYGQDDVFAVAVGDKVRLYGPRNRAFPAVLSGHSDEVTCLAFSARDRGMLATGSKDKTVRLWDRDGKLLHVLKESTGAIYAVCFSYDQRFKFVAAAGEDRIIRVWNPDSGQKVCEFAGHEGPVRALAFAPLTYLSLASAGDDKTVRLWYPKQEVQPITKPMTFHFTDAELQPITLHVNDVPVRTLTFGPGRLAVGGDDGIIRTWAPMGGGALWRPRPGREPLVFRGHVGPVRAIAFHAFKGGGVTMVSGCDDGSIIVWDAVEGIRMDTLQGHRQPVQALAIHSLGYDLLSGGLDAQVLRWPSSHRSRPNLPGMPKTVPPIKQADAPPAPVQSSPSVQTPRPGSLSTPVQVQPTAPVGGPAPVPESRPNGPSWLVRAVILGSAAVLALVLGIAAWLLLSGTRTNNRPARNPLREE